MKIRQAKKIVARQIRWNDLRNRRQSVDAAVWRVLKAEKYFKRMR